MQHERKYPEWGGTEERRSPKLYQVLSVLPIAWMTNFARYQAGAAKDFGFWILDLGFEILDLRFGILDFGFWILDLGF
jgi:hypothetical protein